jgi:hypothetical protein
MLRSSENQPAFTTKLIKQFLARKCPPWTKVVLQHLRSDSTREAAVRAAGVWLEDASVIALYSPGGRRPASGAAYDEVVRTSFAKFVWPSVATDAPEQVWVIGRAVGRALQGLPEIADERVISQPQDRDRGRFRGDVARLRSALPGHSPEQRGRK